MFETLENRNLMSATPAANFSLSYTLKVEGTNANDAIYVNQIGNDIIVTKNGVDTVHPAAFVKGIEVYGKNGDDLLYAFASLTKSVATAPASTGTPCFSNMSRAWYSKRSTGARPHCRRRWWSAREPSGARDHRPAPRRPMGPISPPSGRDARRPAGAAGERVGPRDTPGP